MRHRSMFHYLLLLSGIALLLAPSAEARMAIDGAGIARFAPRQVDYAIAAGDCGPRTVTKLDVTLSGRTRAQVDGRRPFRRTRTVRVRLDRGEAVRIRALKRSGARRAHVLRCLPGDFPEYSYRARKPGRATHGMFSVDPLSLAGRSPNYSIIFSRSGVPIWWLRHDPVPVLDTTVLSDGRIAAATDFGGGFGTDPRLRYLIYKPNGRLDATLQAVGSITDHHELTETPDGNYLLASYVPRKDPVDASAFNGDPSAHVIDSVVQKVSPSGELLWEWNAGEHVDLAETGRWWNTLSEPYDIHHVNSIDVARGGDLLVSLRHTDAVYRLDGRTGKVEWKLGGTSTPKSLRIRGDRYGAANPLGGQHDARFLPRKRVSIHANATNLPDQPPRAVVYRIGDGTATLVRATEDPQAPASNCCGSARVLGSGNWLISWGGLNTVTELTPGGKRRMSLRFAPGDFSYRAEPVPRGATTPRKLRRGMDAQH